MDKKWAGVLVSVTAMVLLWGYLALYKDGQHTSSSRSKRQVAIVVLLILAVFGGGIYSALTFGQPKREEYIQLFILFSGPAAVLVGFAIGTLRKKLDKASGPKQNLKK
jgi:cytochrome bd-type quinol oxidase subunit 2